jgi:hypothetical protein
LTALLEPSAQKLATARHRTLNPDASSWRLEIQRLLSEDYLDESRALLGPAMSRMRHEILNDFEPQKGN